MNLDEMKNEVIELSRDAESVKDKISALQSEISVLANDAGKEARAKFPAVFMELQFEIARLYELTKRLSEYEKTLPALEKTERIRALYLRPMPEPIKEPKTEIDLKNSPRPKQRPRP